MNLVTGSAFDALFTAFSTSAFRLEARDRYHAPEEQERLARYLAGHGYDAASRRATPWWQLIHAATGSGKRVERVRIVTEPHTEYTRYALVGAAVNIDGGEHVHYLDRVHARALELPDHDYWLFDDKVVALMHFGENDMFLGAEIRNEPEVLVRHRQWKKTAWRYATPYHDYIR